MKYIVFVYIIYNFVFIFGVIVYKSAALLYILKHKF